MTKTLEKRSITNSQLRRMGWFSFGLAVAMTVAGGFSFYTPSDVLVIAFLSHAAVSFGLPTARNVLEGYAPNIAKDI